MMAILQLDDRSGRIDVLVRASVLDNARDKLIKDQIVVIDGQISQDDQGGGLRIVAKAVHSLTEARTNYADALEIDVCTERTPVADLASAAARLEDILSAYRGRGCPVTVRYRNDQASGNVALGPEWRVLPCDELLSSLRKQLVTMARAPGLSRPPL